MIGKKHRPFYVGQRYQGEVVIIGEQKSIFLILIFCLKVNLYNLNLGNMKRVVIFLNLVNFLLKIYRTLILLCHLSVSQKVKKLAESLGILAIYRWQSRHHDYLRQMCYCRFGSMKPWLEKKR